MPITNNATAVSTCNQRLIALKRLVNPETRLMIDGKSFTFAALLGIYETCLDTRAALVSLRAALDKGLSERDSAEAVRVAVDKGLRAWVATQFGAGSAEAQELGFLPPKVGEKDARTKAKAAQQSLATREARKTMGKRQRQKIKGTLAAPPETA